MQRTSEEIADAKDKIDALRAEVARVYMGPPESVGLMIVALLARGHVLIEGVPGVAKTTLVKAFAVALGCTVKRIQFTPDLMPADITGSYVLQPRDGTFVLRPGPVFANVVLADEINRAPAKTQSALLEAMQERQVTIEGDRYELPNPFLVLATMNPVDLEGTYPLPEAQIDRFMVRVPMGYPSARAEAAMLRAFEAAPPTAQPVVGVEGVLALQALASAVHVVDDLLDYAVALSAFTRAHPRVLLGASPRASLALIQASKALALTLGRGFVTPDDIRVMAATVLAHRLVLGSDSEQDARSRHKIVAEAVGKVGYQRGDRAR